MALSLLFASIALARALTETQAAQPRRGQESRADHSVQALEACPEELAEGDGGPCAVCLESMRRGQAVRRLSCGHAFHSGCILAWCQHQAQRWAEDAVRCPLCRHCTSSASA
mmetsp:Transcript_62587/g.117073  ORF Transcript_62587/g.117073 Transcript_62587/m.117073 type:complete len:112 (-) Transcript_62587:303-638(-)